MRLQLKAYAQELFDLLFQIPPRFEEARCLIQQTKMTSEDVTRVAIAYADKCFLDYGERVFDDKSRAPMGRMDVPAEKVPELHSAYLCDVISFLLAYGLNANAVLTDDARKWNLMDSLLFIDHEYVAADTMRLLMEHGADPNLLVEGETIFEQVDFGVWFDAAEQEIRWRYDAWVHIWFVLLAYGGGGQEVAQQIQLFKEYGSDQPFDLKKLRDHRSYFYGLSVEGREPMLRIFDKNTLWEVAVG